MPEVAMNGEETPVFRVNLLKAIVPLIPLFLLFLTSKAFSLVSLPQDWLVTSTEITDLKRASELFNSRLVGAAMLAGVGVALFVGLCDRQDRKEVVRSAKAFFEGAGFAFAEIIGIIAAASCFAEGVRLTGLGAMIGQMVTAVPALLLPAGVLFPLGFAFVSGSGMASTQGLYGFFVEPAIRQGFDPATIGSVVALASAAGRTMSPVAAVVLMCARLTDTNPTVLARRVVLPLLTGMGVVLVLVVFNHGRH